jgi:putative transposase
LLDEQYLRTPFYGSRRMTAWLHSQGHAVDRKRVARLMQHMGLVALYPKRRLSAPGDGHRIYPYLLRDLAVQRPRQVFCADITYIPMRRGFLYLVAVLDWYSRYVVAWRTSNSLDKSFCVDALQEALSVAVPEIFNTDQGAQFTCEAFVQELLRRGIRVSMDGRGRALDNVFIERLWRSVKYEEVYLKDYSTGSEATRSLRQYFRFYNRERPHQALGYRTPEEIWTGVDGGTRAELWSPTSALVLA